MTDSISEQSTAFRHRRLVKAVKPRPFVAGKTETSPTFPHRSPVAGGHFLDKQRRPYRLPFKLPTGLFGEILILIGTWFAVALILVPVVTAVFN